MDEKRNFFKRLAIDRLIWQKVDIFLKPSFIIVTDKKPVPVNGNVDFENFVVSKMSTHKNASNPTE